MMNENCTLLVMSCDKYQSAWYPYFELVKKFWPEHPGNIVLSTEILKYSHQGMNIHCSNCSDGFTWSQRLRKALNEIKTDYVFFSLEDFFFQAPVNQDKIDECIDFMEKHGDIAVFRLKSSANLSQKLGEEVLPKFYLAGSDVDFRLETQFALWRKDILLSFIDDSEDPWQFEAYGTKRIADTQYRFLWYRDLENEDNMEKLIAPYKVGPNTGYGITWGKWLWKNRKLFKENGITVDMSELGVLTPLGIKYKLFFNKAIYQKSKKLHHSLFRICYRIICKLRAK